MKNFKSISFGILLFYIFSLSQCSQPKKIIPLTSQSDFHFKESHKYKLAFKNGTILSRPGSSLQFSYPEIYDGFAKNKPYHINDMTMIREVTNQKKGRQTLLGLGIGGGIGTFVSIPFWVAASRSCGSNQNIFCGFGEAIGVGFGIASIIAGTALGALIGTLIKKKEKKYYKPSALPKPMPRPQTQP